MEKEREIAFERIKEIYSDDLNCKIDSYIALFGTDSLEKLLNGVFKERQIKPIKIKLNYKMGKSPIKVIVKDVKIKS